MDAGSTLTSPPICTEVQGSLFDDRMSSDEFLLYLIYPHQ